MLLVRLEKLPSALVFAQLSPSAMFQVGQRWFSESEPELGAGLIVSTGGGTVSVRFRAAGEERTYSIENAPLRRFQFRVGDSALLGDGTTFKVTGIKEIGGLFSYLDEQGRTIDEAQLSDQLPPQGPIERLAAGRFDDLDAFGFRRRSLGLQRVALNSPVRGFVGGRIDLIPHQLYIAHEVSSRQVPRVLLSDEVGLGKTIEAGLIAHRLLVTGRVRRLLVLVPESLVHQWFVEMLRRFNTWLHIFDEERCASIQAGDPGANPFLDDQIVLASIGFLSAASQRAAQAIDAGWDLVIVDEAHHLAWSPDTPSPEYALVEALGRRTSGLLLLTATPEQLGLESHFARLRLLDPDRYSDFGAFQNEPADFGDTARLVERVANSRLVEEKEQAELRRLLVHDPDRDELLGALRSGEAALRAELLGRLLDLHGPGRVLFRNTRAAMQGFPRRRVHLAALTSTAEAELWTDRLSTEFAVDAGDQDLVVELGFDKDPRIVWLAGLLRERAEEKVLLICRTLEKAEAIDEALCRHLNLQAAVFHEGLTLLQRDRNAAWFAEPEGARLLICSEIGSEGRNFQFAHRLVLFDLPPHPELLEQRIGRLDRIGQTQDIEIHVPFLAGSPQEVLARWYHEGLDAFETNLEGGDELFKQFSRQVHDLALEFPVADPPAARAELAQLLQETAAARKALRQRLEAGRDRLLEMNSFRPAVARTVIDAIRAEDADPALPEYLLDVFEQCGVHVEELAPLTWQLNAQETATGVLPGLPAEGMVATCDRRRAVSREDVSFLTWDHPLVTGAMDMLLGSEKGSCAFGVLPHATERTLLIEAVFMLEALGERRLHVDRFLPPTPVRVVVNHKPAVVSRQYPTAALAGNLKKGLPHNLLAKGDIARRVIPAMMRCAEEGAGVVAGQLRADALAQVNALLGREVRRLRALAGINPNVRPVEIQLAESEQAELISAVTHARLRLDCLCLVWKGPMELLA